MKRKIEEPQSSDGTHKKRALSDGEAKRNFRAGLFESNTLSQYTQEYAKSQPYKHCVIRNLIDPTLLRKVRSEACEHLSFTPKETDIYKIHQSGDLANLDGLDDTSLRRLPSLLNLRDALYSSAFRQYVSKIADAGPLSGRKTDMAINVYTPGCHLLCHDDVIGSRRVSYILYLTDPDTPWKAEWGGALRLYPTETFTNEDGTEAKVPTPEFTVSIPPAFNQLSFFAVQPGESFHDVEEVYHRAEGDTEEDGGRIRMAISGWYHIPQEGEEGYEEGLEEKLAEKSSLMQLQGKPDQFDLPKPRWHDHTPVADQEDEPELSEEDLQFLLKYMTPTYLTPDTVEELSTMFEDESSLRLSNFLSQKFQAALHTTVQRYEALDSHSHPSAPYGAATLKSGIARPPHKHRFLYRHGDALVTSEVDELAQVLDVLLPSEAFRKWLTLVTKLTVTRSSVMARRFRRGLDYCLATSYDAPEPQLELCLGITPTDGWGDEGAEDEEEVESGIPAKSDINGKPLSNGMIGASKLEVASSIDDEDNVGGYEVYMAGDDADNASSDGGSDHGIEIPASVKPSSSTGAGVRQGSRKGKADPAIYRSSNSEDEDDGVLFSMPACWNTLSVVLRDTDVLRFVKYVSQKAKGDRWDVVAEFGVDVGDNDDEEVD